MKRTAIDLRLLEPYGFHPTSELVRDVYSRLSTVMLGLCGQSILYVPFPARLVRYVKIGLGTGAVERRHIAHRHTTE